MTEPWSRSVEVPAARLSRWVHNFAERHGPLQLGIEGAALQLRAPDGAIARLEIPYPPLPNDSDPLAALRAHLDVVRTVGVVLVRRGGHAVGVFRGTGLIASKVGSGYVQGRTKAGGWSQQRYARRRANQTTAAYAEAADDVAAVLLPRADDLAGLLTGGDRAGVRAVLADPRLSGLGGLVSDRFLDVTDPRLRVLTAVGDRLTAVRIRLNAAAVSDS